MKRRGDETPTRVAKDQQLNEMVLNAYHSNKLLAISEVIQRPSLMSITVIPLQHSPDFIWSNPIICLFQINKTRKSISCILPEFLKDLLHIKIWSVVLQCEQRPHWPSSNFDCTISRHLLSRHLAHAFLERLIFFLVIRTIFMIVFLMFRNDHNLFAILFKNVRNLGNPNTQTLLQVN